ncbi:MAG TPA: sigma 54 modulation/S30EA ribosomal C-terminal domain-containing protein [Nocardia sp.]|uniref:sigma 54 modulation/S30EA ribosomal C-terminal domain-containing protein n=1 Tax=Nocardia TaxID=1817 RepID=UPI00245403B3|nr:MULTISPECIES: sigma 54 modulation/S30EA ribosomal C-terminal domain-containing protein [Nocardia]HLS77303.1 sigma 54 modulation/S30EA ribosomal C-terminal domain-containing protein [Nocardia sp.]
MGATGALSLSEHWSSAADPDLAVTTRGDVAPADVTRAVRAIGRVLRRHHLNVPARVRITAPTGPDKDRPNVVQANVRLPHTSARVQVTGPRGFAVTFAVERLDRQLTRLAARRGRDWPDPARPPLAEVTPPRPVVRRKRCTLLIGTPAEAIAVMDAMDYDAHLFTDSDTGEDAMVGWTEPSGATLIRQRTTVDVRGRAHEPTDSGPLRVHGAPAPELTEIEAVERLCGHGLPVLFFTDARTGRGKLLYRRYDGDLSIVVPA